MTKATKIKELRTKMGISAKELSNKTGIPYDSLKNYEYGRRKPSGQALAALEQFFEVSGTYLLGESEINESTYIWQDPNVMNAVKDSFPSLFEKLLKTALSSSEFEQKMLFDILVELLHTMSMNKIPSKFKTSAISLLEETFVITTRYIDLCSRICNSSEFEKSRIEKAKQSCIEEYTTALSKAQNDLSK